MWNTKGEKNTKAKLTWDKVKEIRNFYRFHDVSQREIAEKYNVSQRTISYVVTNSGWNEYSVW